jgi:hypothetical protein
MKSSVTWLDRSAAHPLPFFCLCTSEQQFLAAMKHLKVVVVPEWLHDGKPATTHTFEKDGAITCVVCINPKQGGPAKGQVYALLIHEGVHIWQQYCADIGEKNPSSEFEAYTIQGICQRLLYSYDHVVMRKKS